MKINWERDPGPPVIYKAQAGRLALQVRQVGLDRWTAYVTGPNRMDMAPVQRNSADGRTWCEQAIS